MVQLYSSMWHAAANPQDTCGSVSGADFLVAFQRAGSIARFLIFCMPIENMMPDCRDWQSSRGEKGIGMEFRKSRRELRAPETDTALKPLRSQERSRAGCAGRLRLWSGRDWPASPLCRLQNNRCLLRAERVMFGGGGGTVAGGGRWTVGSGWWAAGG